VLGEIPQLLEMARPDFPPCNLSLMTSLSFRMGSLSAAITTSVREVASTTNYPATSTLPGDGLSGLSPGYAFSDRLAPESVIGFRRNQ
jgi:hypothetical protein